MAIGKILAIDAMAKINLDFERYRELSKFMIYLDIADFNQRDKLDKIDFTHDLSMNFLQKKITIEEMINYKELLNK